MPDHLHALFEGRSSDSNVAAMLSLFRQRTGYRYRESAGNRLWQEGYFDRELRQDDDSLAIARYIIGNPVRGGRCRSVNDYPYSGSSRYSLDELIGSMQ
jgi:REP-associated tyrosine transposase